MGEKGTFEVIRGAMQKLPDGYVVKKEKTTDGRDSFIARWDGVRPGLPLWWDERHGVWTPPGFGYDPSDPDRIFNQTTGKNGVWDDKARQWIDAQTGKPLTYEQ